MPDANSITLAEHRTQYRSWGIMTLPSLHRTKEPATRWKYWQDTDIEWQPFINRADAYGIAILLNGLIDIDIEDPLIAQLSANIMPRTGLVFGRKSTGYQSHWIYKLPESEEWPNNVTYYGLNRTQNDHLALAEARSGQTRMTIAPPTIHVSGEPIQLNPNHNGKLTELSRSDALRLTQILALATHLYPYWLPGTRNRTMMALAGYLAAQRWPQRDTCSLALLIVAAAGDNGQLSKHLDTIERTYRRWDDDEPNTGVTDLTDILGDEAVEVAQKIVQGAKAPKAETKAAAKEESNQKRTHRIQRVVNDFITMYRDTWVFVPERKRWYNFNGRYWQPETPSETVRGLELKYDTMAANTTNKEEAAQLRAIADNLINAYTGIVPFLKAAEQDKRCQVSATLFDDRPELLNLENGTLNLDTMTLQPHNAADYLTKYAPIKYDSKAVCPEWDRFIARVSGDSEEWVRFVHHLLGTSLHGVKRDHFLVILNGEGKNGKSVMIEAICKILGSYSAVAHTRAIIASNNDNTSYEVAMLAGARIVRAAETEADKRLSEARVKQLTSSDKLAARRLYQDYVEFTPEFTFFLSTNYLPKIRSADRGIWRRIKLVPFEVTITDEEQVPAYELLKRFSAEASGILNRLIAGYRDHAAARLDSKLFMESVPGGAEPDSSLSALAAVLEEYRTDSDIYKQFIDQHLSHNDEGKSVTAAAVHTVFLNFLEANDYRFVSKSEVNLGRELNKRGYESVRTKTGKVYKGVSLSVNPH